MFRDLPRWAWTLLVGERESAARQRIGAPADLRGLLAELLDSIGVKLGPPGTR
jgi:hypothetical protein